MKNYPAKLLLFGEHTVNAGSQALAIPLPLFSGKWTFLPNQLPPPEIAARQLRLPQFADYLDKLLRRGELLAKIDLAAFRQALRAGIFFDSNIPMGYGAGSSGALVAAVFDRWQLEAGSTSCPDRHTVPADLKKVLAQMEAFFHGTSSGIDPLICFLQTPVLVGGPGDKVSLVELPKHFRWTGDGAVQAAGSYQIFLLDTGMARDATRFIEYFLEKRKGSRFRDRCENDFNAEVDTAIQAFLSGDGVRLFRQVHTIGAFQFKFLPKMIPTKVRAAWLAGLEGDLFKLKVCGAGGGGFVLGITQDFEAVKTTMPKQRLLHVADL